MTNIPETNRSPTRAFTTSLAIAAIIVAAGCANKKGPSVGSADGGTAETGLSTGLEAIANATPNAGPKGGRAGEARRVASGDEAGLEALVKQQRDDLEKILTKGVNSTPTDEWASAQPMNGEAAKISQGHGLGLAAIANETPTTPTETNDPLADAWASAAPVSVATDAGAFTGAGVNTGLAELASGMSPGVTVASNEALPGSGPAPEPVDLWPDQIVRNDESGEQPLEAKIDHAAVGFMDLLRQQAAVSPDPLRPYLMLSVLEAMHPGAAPTILSPNGQASIPLSAEEMKAVESLRQVMMGLTGTTGAPAEKLSTLAESLGEQRPLRLANVQLCTSVRGFGQYTPMQGTRFIAGQAARVIVYAELEGFRTREIGSGELTSFGAEAETNGDTLAVELVQELALYHDADGLRVWSTPESKIVETSRAKRRDFYTVHTVELPTNLGVGAYRLKLVVRDLTNGSVADVNVPVTVVAR